MSLKLKRAVKRYILDYRRFLREQDITTYARGRFARSATTKLDRFKLRKMIETVNARLNEVFLELNERSRDTAREILGDEKLYNRFVRRDKFDLTFSNKFQMARKRIRKLIRKRVTEAYNKAEGDIPAQDLLDIAQEAWETTAEFIKFISYLVADAYNFALFNELEDDSQTGRFEIYLSENHEHNDICNRKVGIFDFGDDVEIPPFHPYCVCSVRAI